MSSLDLGLIGNCTVSALVDRAGEVVWWCVPRFDGDPVFHSLLGSPSEAPGAGGFAIRMENAKTVSQSYDRNTAILRTRIAGSTGEIEITDFAPRFIARGRMFHPVSLIRRVQPVGGSPRIRVDIRPRFDWGAHAPTLTHGSNHIRYVGPQTVLRLTSNAPVVYILEGTEFILDTPVSFVIGPDETLLAGVEDTARDFEERTAEYWRTWCQRLALPLEWQEAVVRAAICLKICTFEETGAIVAAMTTSIPEATGTERNWDYRFCWLRDAFLVVRALNSLAAVGTMESYLRWLNNVIARAEHNHLQPVYGISLEGRLTERIVESLPGYRGTAPVRVGNQAYEHAQHDVYGNAVLGASQAFFDTRLMRLPSEVDFKMLEQVGERAFRVHDKPDASMWELRSRTRIHTSSSLMCWAACDRLAKIAGLLGRKRRAQLWAKRARTIKDAILDHAWNAERGAFVDSFGGKHLDASVLLMAEIGFLSARDGRFIATVERLEQVLARGPHMMRYEANDDFGAPINAFTICAFWRIDSLARIGRREEAREIFEAMLAQRNHLGLLSEHIDYRTGELWGNFPQTYSMVGVINGAMRLSANWDSVV